MEIQRFGIVVKVNDLDACRIFYRELFAPLLPVMDSTFTVVFELAPNLTFSLEKAMPPIWSTPPARRVGNSTAPTLNRSAGGWLPPGANWSRNRTAAIPACTGAAAIPRAISFWCASSTRFEILFHRIALDHREDAPSGFRPVEQRTQRGA